MVGLGKCLRQYFVRFTMTEYCSLAMCLIIFFGGIFPDFFFPLLNECADSV